MFTFKGTKEYQDSGVSSATTISQSKYKPSIELPSLTEIEPDVDHSQLHLLPCSIGHNGHANVSNYLKVKQSKDGDYVESSIRGITIIGKKLDIPKDYQGVILRSENNNNNSNGTDNDVKMISDNAANKWEAISLFNNFTYWNREKKPTDSDSTQQAFKWISIAEKIHQKITFDQLYDTMHSQQDDSTGTNTSRTNTSSNSTPKIEDIKEPEKENGDENGKKENVNVTTTTTTTDTTTTPSTTTSTTTPTTTTSDKKDNLNDLKESVIEQEKKEEEEEEILNNEGNSNDEEEEEVEEKKLNEEEAKRAIKRRKN